MEKVFCSWDDVYTNKFLKKILSLGMVHFGKLFIFIFHDIVFLLHF